MKGRIHTGNTMVPSLYSGGQGNEESIHNRYFTNINKHMSKTGYVYIVSNKKHGTLYIGVASDLSKRIWQHKNKIYQGFTSKYGLNILVYYEELSDIKLAIIREKQIKGRLRIRKIHLIESVNSNRDDLYQNHSFTNINTTGLHN